MPKKLIEAAKLIQTGGIEAKLADGSGVMLESYTCIVSWFDQDVPVEAIANDGEFPLLGIGLLIGHRLSIDYTKLTVFIE
jgi:predicted aspartyl protease